MLILTLRTDNPQAELGLFDGEKELVYKKWQAHRQLAETLHKEITELLQSAGKTIDDLQGIVTYRGPGSFTGLRIGLSVTNALAYSLNLSVAGTGRDDWQVEGISILLQGKGDKIALPEYGASVYTTAPKK